MSKQQHDEATCMCDECIKARTRKKVAEREQQISPDDPYIRRRGGMPPVQYRKRRS